MKVPFLGDCEIEGSADCLISKFCWIQGTRLALPVPVETMLEMHLRLTFGFDDLHARFSVPQKGHDPDMLGMLFVHEGDVLINEALDPGIHPSQEARFRSAIAHQIGHWVLHRELITNNFGEPGLSPMDRPV